MKSPQISNQVWSLAAALWLAAASASAQSPVAWSLAADATAKALQPGDRFSARLSARIEEGWHLYSLNLPPGGPLATRISLAEGQAFRAAGSIEAPLPVAGHDQAFNIPTEFYEASVTFTIPMEVVTGVAPGPSKLKVEAFFQACNDQLCLPPTTVSLEADVTIAAESAPAKGNADINHAKTLPQAAFRSAPARRIAAPRLFRWKRWSRGGRL